LAISLTILYKRTGDVSVLDKAVDLQREALDLCPVGHPHRAMACEHLATSLIRCYERTGDASLLDKSIDLEREALDLRPAGHPDRALSCGNLPTSLLRRYERTGDDSLLHEAIDLEREGLGLLPTGRPNRAMSCGNLANLLMTRYARTEDVSLLDEAIDLQREALDLRFAGHQDRAMSCGNLATLLMAYYERTGEVDLLNEAISMQREALDLSPAGHPYRYVPCGNLASSLKKRYELTRNAVDLDESFALFQEAVKISPVHAIWSHSHRFAVALLQNTTPFYDVRKAVLYLSQSLQHDPENPLVFIMSLSSVLNKLWQRNAEEKHSQLTAIYQRLVSLLPLLVHPAVGLQLQLQALKRCTQLGPDTFVNAALADDWAIDLETLELAQGVIWSTVLHRRDPQLKDVPEYLASQMQGLLQSFDTSPTDKPDDKEWKSFIQPQDILHAQSSRLYAVIREIRALPGLERFMLGESVDTLRAVASNHPVVILVSARGHHYALILAPLTAKHALLSLDITPEEERILSATEGSMRQSRGSIIHEVSVERALKISAPLVPMHWSGSSKSYGKRSSNLS
jgi:tetratricopeptide (TPR) repeat protein